MESLKHHKTLVLQALLFLFPRVQKKQPDMKSVVMLVFMGGTVRVCACAHVAEGYGVKLRLL